MEGLSLNIDNSYVTVFIVVALTIVLWIKYRRPTHYPPGPTPIPLIGNLHNLNGKDIRESLIGLRKKYGDIFSLSIGSFWVVFVHGIDNLRELMVKHGDATSDRPPIFLFTLPKFTGDPDLWKYERPFILTRLRDFGCCKMSFESSIIEEVNKTITAFERHEGKPFDCSKLLIHAASDVVFSITIGRRFEYDDSNYRYVQYLSEDLFESEGLVGILNFMPFLSMIPGDPFGGQKIQRKHDELIDFFQDIVKEHKKTFDENNIRDLIDAYLKRMKGESDFENENTEKVIASIVAQLLRAGSETSAVMLTWAILFLIRNPDTQTKMRKEIDDVVGTGRFPSMSDKTKLPYCEAVVLESLRMANIAPLAVPHYVTRDIQHNGHIIPQHSILLPVLESALFDEEIFPQCDKFDPERFFDSNGKLYGHDRVPAFSMGRRGCPGESLARMEIFLFLTSIVQRFLLQTPKGDDLHHVKGKLGLTYAPAPFTFCAVLRN